MVDKRLKKIYEEFPDFTPNLTPEEMFRLGSFGGTYWRPIKSNITSKNYKNQHLEFPKSWWSGLPDKWLVNEWKDYDTSINKYKVKVGTTLRFWEKMKWISKDDPYGWVQWYCRFYQGRRTKDDERQIKRWGKLAGPKGRFRRRLMNQIIKENKRYNDYTISPVIRQVLLHWGYELSSADLNNYKRSLKK